MATPFRSATSLAIVAIALPIFGLPIVGYSSTLSTELLLTRNFTSIQLSEIQTTTTPTSEVSRWASTAAFGPVENIDLIANRMVVAGQLVDMTGLNIDDFEQGDLVSVSGLVASSGISEATIELLPNAYVYGATLSYVEGYVTKSNPSNASATIGDSTVDFSMALSKSIGAAADVLANSFVRVVGIQMSSGDIVAADLQIIPPSIAADNSKKPPSAESAKAHISINYDTKAILGGDRSAKAILGGDRSVKAIIGGDRSAKAILGGDRSAKAIIGGDRSAKAILGGDRSVKAVIGGDRSTKAILGGDRSVKAIIGGDRSAKAILGGDRSAKAISDRSAKLIVGGDRPTKAIRSDALSRK